MIGLNTLRIEMIILHKFNRDVGIYHDIYFYYYGQGYIYSFIPRRLREGEAILEQNRFLLYKRFISGRKRKGGGVNDILLFFLNMIS